LLDHVSSIVPDEILLETTDLLDLADFERPHFLKIAVEILHKVVNQTSVIVDKKIDLSLVFQKVNSVLIQYAGVMVHDLLVENQYTLVL
jgi:hypothetical protein